MGDSIKSSKSATIKRRKIKKRIVVDEVNVELAKVGGGDAEIYSYDVALIVNRRKEV